MTNVNMTEVRLLSVPLEKDLEHTISFKTIEEQINYFYDKTVYPNNLYACNDFTYQRKDNVIRFPLHADHLMHCNYVMYKNTAYANKWFFAFITDIKYINDGRSDVYIKTDPIQTWMFDYVVNSSFVEREHVDDDTIGYHTVPEQLDTGDFIVNKSIKHQHLLFKGFVIGATVDLTNSDFPPIVGALYGGVYSGIHYYYYGDPNDISEILQKVAVAGKTDSIETIFIVPSMFINQTEGAIANEWNPYTRYWSDGVLGVDQESVMLPETVDGYKPKNNKLFTHPYSYILMSNNSGGNAVYKYELFGVTQDEPLCDFRIDCVVTPGCSIRLTPVGYNGVFQNNEEGLNLGKFPICSWASDIYTNWLTQNALNIPIQLGVSALSLGLPTLMGSGTAGDAYTMGSGLTGITSTLMEKYQRSFVPLQAEGNINSGDVTFAKGDLTFTAYQMSVKYEFAKIIDEYFSMFGYKVACVKVPNKNHRKRYWFTKTINANISGNIPQADLREIKNAYNKGITFWRNGEGFRDYSEDNPIVYE